MSEQDKKDAPQLDAGNGASGSAGAATLNKPAPERVKPRQLPPYKVLLHNDDVNPMEHVVLSIVKVTPLSIEDAELRMLEAHQRGVALLLVTHRERAELYQEQFHTFKLTVSIEPDAS